MGTDQRDPLEELPLTPVVFHILLALADAEKHGYAIMKEVETTTEGTISMGPGTLYGTLKRLDKAQMIQESDERPDPHLDDARRRYYELTGYGRQVLQAEVERLAQAVKLAKRKAVWVPRALATGGQRG